MEGRSRLNKAFGPCYPEAPAQVVDTKKLPGGSFLLGSVGDQFCSDTAAVSMALNIALYKASPRRPSPAGALAIREGLVL